jgi:single-stranded-DNA-specific exonuclease
MEELGYQEVEAILAQRFRDDSCMKLSEFYSPMLFCDMERSAKRVAEAVKNGEPITVIGDYDADGVIASYVLCSFLETIGAKQTLIIPNRFTDGYGFSPKIAQNLPDSLVVTVDNGITSNEAAQICKERGLDLIITDHHTPLEVLPEAYSIVDPKLERCDFPNSAICGAVIAWYLCAAIKSVMEIRYDLSRYLDLLAIATVADMMPLNDINRVIVQQGIKRLNAAPRPFIQAIRESYGREELRGEDISFLIAPLINSAGRMEDACLAYDLIDAVDDQSAHERLEAIKDLNNYRKEIESHISKKAARKVRESDNFIVVWDEDWHEGVIGIVASRISRQFKKPTIVLCVKDGCAKGSGRSYGDIDIFSLIKEQQELLIGFGGHRLAAGLSIACEHLETFRDNIAKTTPKSAPVDIAGRKDILGQLRWHEIDLAFVDMLRGFEPFGVENAKPLFLAKAVTVRAQKSIGFEKNHSKFVLEQSGKQLEAICFNFSEDIEHQQVDMLFSVNKNVFRSTVTTQLMIEEFL